MSRVRPIWLLTFSDLVALLLAFFVMLFATHRVEQHKWTALIQGLSQTLRPESSPSTVRPSAYGNVQRLSPNRAADLRYLEALLREFLSAEPAFAKMAVRRLDDRLVLALPTAGVFDRGKARVKEPSREALFALGGVLRNIGNRILVHGHSDPSPIKSGKYESNWELSLARAAAVESVLRRAGYKHDITPIGYADTRFRDLFGAGGLRPRFALGRRVDVIILATRAKS